MACSLEKDNIKIDHFPGELRIPVNHDESVNFYFLTKDFIFAVKSQASSGHYNAACFDSSSIL